MLKIYHNPRCRKSREALAILLDKGHDPEIIQYLKDPPSIPELKDLLVKMDMKPEEIIRTGEKIYRENYKGRKLTDEEWFNILVENPILIERPIVVSGEKAVLGRPPEKILEII